MPSSFPEMFRNHPIVVSELNAMELPKSYLYDLNQIPLFMKHLLGACLLIPQLLFSQVVVQKHAAEKTSDFTIASGNRLATVCYDANDFASVKKTAQLFAEDVERVTGRKPLVTTTKSETMILIGTIERNLLIKELVRTKKLNIEPIRNGWEQFAIKTIDNPFKGMKKALVIAGSDRRGASFGAFTVSEAMGVSPWYWWADVPVQQSAQLSMPTVDFTSKSPTVKYRGIFINDEDWGLKPWATKNFEKDLGDIGPKTYAKVCELLLRLKANMVAPAMHSCTGAFYSNPESKVVADEYGIILTTSHCEPLLFNNAAKSEWDTKVDGDWNYGTNKNKILEKLDNRVHEAAPYENIYTVGLRGLHDEGMRGSFSREEKVAIVANAMTDERSILGKYILKPIRDIPQIYVPYKEALDVYNDGLKVPEDVTLVWVDDNYGYMKRLSDSTEQKRSGGGGVYYHTSYLGGPHDYLWLCTTPPVLMYEELKKAYDTGADRYWLLNVGDIKPAELGMQTFFDLAWNVNQFDQNSINQHQSRFLARTFGKAYEQDFQDILDQYYRLAWSRKPEFMGWEREWDAPKYRDIAPTEFSFQHYNDAQQRLSDYQRISDLSETISNALPEALRPSFYELVAYPVMGSYQMNRKFLLAQLNSEQFSDSNFAAANWAGNQSKAAFDSINSLTRRYNTMLQGKWDGMMALASGWVAKYQNMPNLKMTEGVEGTSIDLRPKAGKNKLEGCSIVDLKKLKPFVSAEHHTLGLLEGIGYDWCAARLGKATEPTADPTNLNGSRFEYEFSGVAADSVTVYVYTVPFFALHKGKSTKYGISVDNQPAMVVQNDHKEFTEPWKDRVLRNGALSKATFRIDSSSSTHRLKLTCGDPGILIERVLIDWGGLKKTYVGPSFR